MAILADDFRLAGRGRPGSRSAASMMLDIPRTTTSLGDRAFAVAGPRVWNSLPPAIRDPSQSPSIFGKLLISPCRSTSVTLQLQASLHIFLKRISPKLRKISVQRKVYFHNLARYCCYQVQIEYAGCLNLDKIAYHRVAQPQ